jgi:hypothetical protein
MTHRLSPTRLLLIAAFVLTACGGDDETATSDVAESDVAAETTAAPEAEDPPAESTTTTEAEPEPAQTEPCAAYITVEDIDRVLGVPVEITGSDTTCQLIYADDAVGSFQAFPERRADDALVTLEKFKDNPDSMGGGVLLDNDRGFISGNGLTFVVGDSGQIFSMSTPDNIGVDDLDARLMGFVDILLTK